mmetsp:Transcript_49248/g.50023  ORF Transcript_49248/g.50023 Transcript_49248/m.50023 type:complete len:119 (+) Transcript_49248:2699-3055(+)
MATENNKNLRHRTSVDENNTNNIITEKGASRSYNHMAYSRRSIATPFSRFGNGNALPKNKNLTSYRNKIIAILVVTSCYTTFLYQRGQYLFVNVYCCEVYPSPEMLSSSINIIVSTKF